MSFGERCGPYCQTELSAVLSSTLSVHYLFHHGSAIVLKKTCVDFVIEYLLTSWFVQVGRTFSPFLLVPVAVYGAIVASKSRYNWGLSNRGVTLLTKIGSIMFDGMESMFGMSLRGPNVIYCHPLYR